MFKATLARSPCLCYFCLLVADCFAEACLCSRGWFTDTWTTPFVPRATYINILFAVFCFFSTILGGAAARWLSVVVTARCCLLAFVTARCCRLLYCYFAAREVVAVDKFALCNFVVYVAR